MIKFRQLRISEAKFVSRTTFCSSKSKRFSRGKTPRERVRAYIVYLVSQKKVMRVCRLLCRMDVSLVMVSDRDKAFPDYCGAVPKLCTKIFERDSKFAVYSIVSVISCGVLCVRALREGDVRYGFAFCTSGCIFESGVWGGEWSNIPVFG